MSSTILIVDDHPVFRRGLCVLLEKNKDLCVIAEADNGLEAMEQVRKHSPDIVVMDITMPNLDGIEATRQILSKFPETRVVALSVHSGKRFVRDMLQAGASGYILKESVPEEMIQGIRTVLAGKVYLSQSISGIVVSDYKDLLTETHQSLRTPPESILRTKLRRPPISADIIPRLRLLEMLEAGRQRPMTLISAPAGYGKSILASQWLETCECPGAWVTLDENENDLRMFLTYLLEAVQITFPETNLETKILLRAARLPHAKDLTHNLLNDIERVNEPFILVLDDYHRIHEAAVHDLLIEMLRHPSPMLHLAVLTRRDPSLPIGPMRARSQLTEIAMEQLRFSLAETQAFMERLLSVTIDQQTASLLDEKLEGWVTGLRLTALSVSRKDDLLLTIQGLKQGSYPFVREYLFQEVLAKTPAAFARYLLETSILERFCASLCDALHASNRQRIESEDEYSGQSFIDWLEKSNLFVIPLDETHHWFRYHHLFQELLQSRLKRQLSPNHIRELHSRACAWYSEKGLIDEAVRHALAADDMMGATRLVEQNRQAMFNLDRWYVIERWLSLFPEHVVHQHVELSMAKAWVLYHHFDIPALHSVVDAADALLSEQKEDQPLRGEIDFFRGYLCYFQNDGTQSLKHLNHALKRIPETYHEIRGQSEILHGLAGQMQGEEARAVETLNNLLLQLRSSKTIRVTRLQVTLVYIHTISGNLPEALLVNQQLNDFAAKNEYAYARAWSLYLQGLIHFYQDDLEEAIGHFHQALEQKYLLHTRAIIDGMAGLVYAYQARGLTDPAEATMKDLFAYVDHLDDSNYSMIARASHVRLSIMQGNLKPGLRWLQESPPTENMVWWLEIPAVTYCRALIAEGSNRSLEKSEATLRGLLQQNQDNHNVCHRIQMMPLLAVTLSKEKRLDEALAVLKEGVAMAEPGGWIRPFVELGEPMADLLKSLLKQNVAGNFIEKLLSAVPASRSVIGNVPSASEGSTPVASRRPKIENALIEPLTNRELDILELLAQRFQSKEIADRLCISPETVKSHLKNIYQKLSVGNRREAVEKAKILGILTAV